MAVSANSLLDYNKIIDLNARNRAMQLPLASNNYAFLRFLLSRQNRTSPDNPIDLDNARRLMEQAMLNDNSKTVMFTVLPRFNARKVLGVAPQVNNECDYTGAETTPPVKAQLDMQNRIQATATFDPRVCSDSESIESQLANTYRQLYDEFTARLYGFAIVELARKKAGGSFVHIGNSPGRDADISFAPGKVVNIFKADGETPNKAGVIGLQQELTNAGISENGAYAWGDSIWDSLARSLPGFSQGDASGFDYSILRVPFLQNNNFMMNVDISTVFRNQGIENPLLIVKAGHVQLVTSPRWGRAGEPGLLQTNTGKQMREVVVVPGLNIEADLTINIEDCGDYPLWRFKLETRAALFTIPGCITEALNDDFLAGYNGLMLYSGGCNDETFCEQQPFVRTIQDSSTPYQNCEPSDVVCDTITTCSADVRLSYGADGSLTVTAHPQPLPPATVATLTWTKNGTPLTAQADKLQFTLPAASWANGDVFEVTVVDTSGCSAVASKTAETLFASARVQYNSTNQPNGTEIKVGETAGSGTVIYDLVISSLDDDKPLSISSLLIDNDNPAMTSSYSGLPVTFPTTVSPSFPLTINIVQETTVTGTINHTLQFTSNDPQTPTYELTFQVTVS